METLSVLQSLIMALWVAAIMSRWLGGGATLTLRFSPLMTGLVAGLVMGDVPKAMIVTAALQMIYMGVFSPGGSMPAEPSIAAAIAVPVALLGNLKPEAAIAVAVPVGLLGSYLYLFRFFINTFLGKYTDRAVAELNSKKIARSIIWSPTIASFIKALEGTVVIHVLEVVGGGLAAIGIATTVYVIGRKDFLVFFFLAYFMSIVFKSLEITMVTYAIFGVIIALIFVQVQKGKPVAESAGSASATTDFDDDDDYDDGF